MDKLWKSRGLTEVQQGLTDKILGKPNELTGVVGDVVRFLGWPFLAFKLSSVHAGGVNWGRIQFF